MKKIVIISIALLFLMTGIVSADGNAQDSLLSNTPVDFTSTRDLTQTTTYGYVFVSYSITAETYTVIIPDSFSFSDLQSNIVNTKVVAKNVVLEEYDVLNISVSSTHGWTMVSHIGSGENEREDPNGGSISYSLTYDSKTYSSGSANTATLLTVNPGTQLVEMPLKFTMTGLAPSLGTYKDKLTFTTEIITPGESSS